jgi:alkylhydroperoxidase family enzyme
MLTRVADTHVPDAEYEAARSEFWEQELMNLGVG